MENIMAIIGAIVCVAAIVAFWVDNRLEKKAIKKAELESLKKG